MFIKRKNIMSILIILLLLGLCACQPTPDKEIVIQKDNFENEINTTAVPVDIEANNNAVEINSDNIEHIYWQDVFSKDFASSENNGGYEKFNLTITVDADVPKVVSPAGVYMVEPEDFGKDFACNAVEYLLDGNYYDDIFTKDDWMIRILPIEMVMDNMVDKLGGKDGAESLLKVYKGAYNRAPDNNTPGSLEFEQGRFSHIAVKGYPAQGTVAELYVGNGGQNYTDFYYYAEDGKQVYRESKEEYKGTAANGMTKSYDEAEQIAMDAIDNLFDKEMALVQTTLANKLNIDEEFSLARMGYVDYFEQCYVFYFTPFYGTAPQLYAPEALNYSDIKSGGVPVYEQSWDYEYSMKWPAEYTKVIVDDTGIVQIWSFSPSKVVETINDNVQMLSFEEVFEVFKRNIFYSSAWEGHAIIKIDIDIDKIVFGMIRVPVKDNPSQYYMVPAWQFIGSKYEDLRTSSDEQMEGFSEAIREDMEFANKYSDYSESGKTFIVINAIDGSIIDTSYFIDVQMELEKYIGKSKD